MAQFDGKVALVTGAASGIGRATAIAFAREGAAVVVADIADDGGHETVALIEAAGGQAAFARADVSQADQVAAMVQLAVDRFGGLDMAFNNAGYDRARETVVDLSEEEFDRTIAINLKGVFLGMKYQIPAMLKRGGGSIVNTSSGLGLFALPRTTAYVTSKHAVIGLGKAAAVDFGPQGIRVNTVAPGKTATPMLLESARRSGIDLAETCGAMPLRRVGEPDELAAAVIWLCSDASSFVTGLTMIVDGGSSIVRGG